MAYDSTVPTTGHSPSQDYTTIQGNFAQIATSYNTDHVALSGGTPVGFHKQVSLSTYGSSPYAVSGAQSYVYSSNASAAGSQLLYQPSVVAFGLPVSAQVLGRIKWDGANWVSTFVGSGNNFNLNTTSGVKASPVVTFANALANTTYYQFLCYEPAGATPIGVLGVSSKSTTGFTINIQNSASVATNDTIVILVY